MKNTNRKYIYNEKKIKYLNTKFYWKLHCIIKNKKDIF